MPEWLKHMLVNERFQSRLDSIVTRTTIDTVTAPEVKGLRIGLPDTTEQHTMAAVLDGVDEAIERGRAEAHAIRSLKASAADALLTGRVRVGSHR